MNNNCIIGYMVVLVALALFGMAACVQTPASPDEQPSESWSESETDEAAAESELIPPPEFEEEATLSDDPSAEQFIAEDIYFKKGSAALQPEARVILQRKVGWLLDNPDVKIIIQGHTDEPGSKEANFALGDRRAGSVISYLIELGIDMARMTAVSYGNEKPVSMGTDEESRAQNRRVHMEFDIHNFK